MNNSIKIYKNLVSPFNQSKVLLHKDKFDELKQNIIASPVCCEIDLADSFCNNKCKHCFFGTNNSNKRIFIDKYRLKAILYELRNIGVKAIEFSGGGEPLTHPYATKIIKFTSAIGFDIGLVTNGLLLDKVFDIADKFKFIRISLDSTTRAMYYETHGVDCFDRVVDNIAKLCDKKCGDIIGIGYLITGINNSDIIDAALLAKNLGVRFIQYRPASLPYKNR